MTWIAIVATATVGAFSYLRAPETHETGPAGAHGKAHAPRPSRSAGGARPSPYWKLERRYWALHKQAGRLGAEIRRLRAEKHGLRRAVTVLRVKAEARATQARLSTTGVIRLVFGSHGDEAVRVVACETGDTFSTTAQNGQYLGLFQMGDYARSTYGHGATVLEQALAAYRYFLASGSDWSPWACKP